MRSPFSRLVPVLVLAACSGDDAVVSKDDPGPDHTGTAPTWPTTPPFDPCDEPLVLAPEVAGVAPLAGTRFLVTGGSGDFRFSFVDNQSGGRIAERSGEYLAGPTTAVDTVRVDDATCNTDAEATIEVLGALSVAPLTAVVPPGVSFTIEVAGGSGRHRCEPVTLFVGSLAGCTWTAGTDEGTDTLRVVDEDTNQSIEVAYTIDTEAGLSLWGTRLVVPTNVALAPTMRGGTGVYDYAPDDGSVTVGTDGTLTATQAGEFEVQVTDHFVPALTASFPYEAVDWLTATSERDGERMVWGSFATADLDGDGDDEVVFGTPDLADNAHDSGGVFVWDPTVSTDPVWSWSVAQQFAGTGRSVATGDLNGDGNVDLAVGSDGWDVGFTTDYGRVDVFYGDGAGGFGSDPDVTFEGSPGDRLGHGLAMCDVDGDGISDLLASALSDDDASAPGINNQGSISVWSGTTFGVDRVEAGKVHAWSPVDGVFTSDADANLGRRLATGDWDGDGRCDAFATNHTVNLDGAGSDGMTWMFLADSLLASGLPDRVWSWNEADDNVQSGRNLAVGDLDGDGLDDLALGAHTADRSGSTRGAVFVFLAADDDGRPPESPVWLSEASATLEGDDDNDSFGLSVRIADATGDGAPDLVVGGQNDEVDGGPGAAGTVRVFDGPSLLAGTLGTTSDAATFAAGGVDVNDTFGTEVAVVQADGDAAPELVTYASRDDGEGIEAGGLYLVELDGTSTRLALPGAAAGQYLGDDNTLSWVDADGDGDADVVAGTWGAPRGTDGFDAGLVQAFGGGTTPTLTLGGVPNHSANDRFGFAVDRAGDFDGDGRADLAVAMPFESRPTTFGAEFSNPTECAGSIGSAGAVWVYLGTGAGLPGSPSFVFYMPNSNDRIEAVAGGFDHDGDGFDDLVLGSTQDGPGNEGGFTIVHGRPEGPAGIAVICSSDFHAQGVTANSRLGVAVSGVGDLDGDGCDEVAVGADSDDLGFGNQGSVRIAWGFGPACGSSTAQVTTLAPLVANTRVGTGVDGGLDADGDGVPDVVVGGFDYEVTSGTDVGAAWLLSGAWVASLPRQSADPLPADLSTTVTALPADHLVTGDQRDAEFGAEVALVAAPRGAWLAVGWRYAALGAPGQNGAVALYEWRSGAFSEMPVTLVLGDRGSQLGDALRRHPTERTLAVGAPLSDGGGLDGGGVLPVPVR